MSEAEDAEDADGAEEPRSKPRNNRIAFSVSPVVYISRPKWVIDKLRNDILFMIIPNRTYRMVYAGTNSVKGAHFSTPSTLSVRKQGRKVLLRIQIEQILGFS